MHMRKSVIILAALLTATPAIAAEECQKTEAVKHADTAQCLLWVDGKLVTGNDSCKVVISGDMRSFAIKDVAEVSSRPKTKLPALGFEAHVLKLGKWVNYGLFDGEFTKYRLGWENERFHMILLPPYLICDPELEKASESSIGENSDQRNMPIAFTWFLSVFADPSLHGRRAHNTHEAREFNSWSECEAAREAINRELPYPSFECFRSDLYGRWDAIFVLVYWSYGQPMGPVGWVRASDAIDLEECVKERAHVHFRGEAMLIQERGAANDKHLGAHQPRCIPYTKWTAMR
jgi:hypothetical protein